MTGYENQLAVFYHAGPPIYGMQAIKVKVIDMNDKSYKTLFDVDCPVSCNSTLVWVGYSEDGQLFSYDSEGVLRAFNFQNNQWSPMIDFKLKFPDTFQNIWITGISD